MLVYRGESCGSCGWHEGDSERDWEVRARTCPGCRMLHEAKGGENEKRPPYVHQELRKASDDDEPEEE